MALNFNGQYWDLNLDELSRIRRIWGSVLVADCPRINRAVKTSNPPRNDPIRLNVAAPITAAQKNSFLSTPRIVSGLFSDLYTRFMRMIVSLAFQRGRECKHLGDTKQPRHKVHRSQSDPETEHNAGKDLLGLPFAEGKHQTANNNRDERQPSS